MLVPTMDIVVDVSQSRVLCDVAAGRPCSMVTVISVDSVDFFPLNLLDFFPVP